MTSAHGWTAVAVSRQLGRRPKRIIVEGRPYVLFRDGGTVRCLVDKCPHRHAPLSLGRVVEDKVECAYHGWRFDGSGVCRDMPGLCDATLPRIMVPARRVTEAGGLIFLATGDPNDAPYVSSLTGGDTIAVRTESLVNASLVDVAENILDATHTHFTHKGLLRGLSRARRKVDVTVTRTMHTVEARYEGEARQDGVISRLLEGGRTISVGRFIGSGIAELEFYGADGPNLVTTFHLREEMPGVTRGIAILTGPRQGGLGYIKAALFVPLFKIAYLQDRRILAACSANRARFDIPPALMSPLDILRADIETLAAGGTLAPAGLSSVMSL